MQSNKEKNNLVNFRYGPFAGGPPAGGPPAGGPPAGGSGAVSYTHLTLPTKLTV